MRHKTDGAHCLRQGRRIAGHFDTVDGIEKAHAIVAADCHTGFAGYCSKPLDPRGTVASWRLVSATEYHGTADPSRRGVRKRYLDKIVGNGKSSAIHWLRQCPDIRIGASSRNFIVARIDGVDLTLKASTGNGIQQPHSKRTLARRCTYNRDG